MATPCVQTVEKADVISLAQIRQVSEVCKLASDAARELKKLEADRDIALMALFEPLLGIKTKAELQAMSVLDIQRTIRRRVDKGLIELRGIKLEALINKVVQQSACARYVSWKDEYIKALGESAAIAVQESTSETHSFRVVAP